MYFRHYQTSLYFYPIFCKVTISLNGSLFVQYQPDNLATAMALRTETLTLYPKQVAFHQRGCRGSKILRYI